MFKIIFNNWFVIIVNGWILKILFVICCKKIVGIVKLDNIRMIIVNMILLILFNKFVVKSLMSNNYSIKKVI